MDQLFSTILNMSATGSIVILLVILTRLFLKRVPKMFSYALWIVVLFRLLCPVAFTAPVSVLEPFQAEARKTSDATSIVYFTPPEAPGEFQFVSAEPANTAPPEEVILVTPSVSVMDVLPWIWAAGVSAMLLCSGIQYLQLRQKLIGSMPIHGNIHMADGIEMPFVLGILRPRIYLPTSIPESERKFIIAHENHHIRRGDPLVKMMAFLALCIHWFNPLVWLAFVLAGRDMEMSCDEAVIRRMGPQIRADYSAALLRLTSRRRTVAGISLAFGEGDTRSRIMNIAKWKKPGLLGLAIGLVLCIVLVIACSVNPAATSDKLTGPTELSIDELTLWIPEGLTIEQDKNQTAPTYILRKGEAVAGGVHFLQKPVLNTEGHIDPWDWVAALNVPENVPEDRFIMSVQGWMKIEAYCVSANYGKNGVVETAHYFYEGETVVYDLWFDMTCLSEAGVTEILNHTRFNPISAKNDVPKPTLAISKLSNGCVPLMDADGNILFSEDGETYFAGITFYPIPEGVYDPNDTIFLWLENVGIPDFEDSSLCYMGGISSIASEGGWIAEFASDVPPGTAPAVSHRHLFLVSGNYVVDIWVDLLKTDYRTAEELFAAVQIVGSPQAAADSSSDAEEAAFLKCAAVFDAVQAGAYQIDHHQKLPDATVYAHSYLQNGGDWLHIQTTLDESPSAGYMRSAALCFANTYFTNQGHQQEPGNITWVESSPIDPIPQPWLARFYWTKANVTYMDTLYDTEGCTIMYRIDKHYSDQEGDSDHYFASFRFDSQDRFQNVVLEVNLYQDNAFTVTESIVSLDTGSVAVSIYEQYTYASGTYEVVADHPLESCQGVVEAIQSLDAWKIVTERKNTGFDIINPASSMCYWKKGANWLHTNAIEESDVTLVMGICHIDGIFYDNLSAGASPQGAPIVWQEAETAENCIPWLASYQWDRSLITVVSVEETENGTEVTLDIQDIFRLGKLEQHGYRVDFLFDRTGRFVSATVTVEFSNCTIIENMKIASIDAEAIASEMAQICP